LIANVLILDSKRGGEESVIRAGMFRAMLLVLIVVGTLSAVAGAAGSIPGEPQKARCIRQGLAPISVDVGVSVRGLPEASRPYLHIRWSGPAIPAACQLDRSVAAHVEVRFAKVPKRMSFSFGFPSRWLVFWGAQRNKTHGHTEYEGQSVEGEALGCIRNVWARLRYRVLTPSGEVVAQRVRTTRAHYARCPKMRLG
jgi:hypothetical protein